MTTADELKKPIPVLVRVWTRTPLKDIFTWRRTRVALVIVVLLFLALRVALGLLLNFALDRATRGTLGLSCQVGGSALNLTAGTAVLSDVALVGSSGTSIATIGRAELDVSWLQLPNLIVDHMTVEDVELTLKRDAMGRIPAFSSLLQGDPKAAPKTPTQPAVTTASTTQGTAASTADAPLPIMLLRRMRVHHIRLQWEDETVRPTFKGEVLLDARGDEIATFPRAQPPSFSLRLVSPGVLDSLRFDVAGRTLEDGVSAFDIMLGAEAHPRALAPYLGNDVEVTAKTLALAVEAHANARPTYLEGNRYFTGDFTLERGAIKADDDEFDLGRIVTTFSRLSRERVDVSSISIDHPRLSFGRLADGALRILGFGLHGKGGKKTEEAPPSGAPMRLPVLQIGEVALHDGTFHFQDDSTKTPVVIDADYQGRVQDVTIDRAGPGHRARLEASCSLDGIVDKMAVTGSFVPVGDQRDVSLDFSAEGIELKAITPYLKLAGLEPDLKRGSAHASFHAQAVSVPDGTLGFSAELTKASYVDTDELMGLQALRVEGGEVDAAGNVSLERLSIENPGIELRRHKSGALALAGIRTARVAPGEAPAPVTEPAEEPVSTAEPAKKTRIRIGEIALHGGKVGWKDDALHEPVQLAVDGGTFELLGLTLGDPESPPATLRASARLLPSVGDVSLEAGLIPDGVAPAISGTFTAKDVSMKAVAEYLKVFSIDPTLERGRFEAGIQAKAAFKGAALKDASLVLAPVTVKTGVDELGGIDSIELKGMSIDPATKTTNLGDLTITGVRGRAYRDAQGAIRVLGLKLNPKAAETEAKAAPVTSNAAPRAAAARPGILRMGEVAIKNASFSWHDEMTTPPADVRLDRLDVTLGPRRLDRDPRPGEPPVPLKVHAEIDRVATLDVDAGVGFAARTPAVTADLHVTDLTLAAVAPYLSPAGYTPILDRATLDGKLVAQMQLDEGITSAKLELASVKYADGGQELLGLDDAKIPFDLDSIAHAVHVGEVVVQAPRLAASRTKDGSIRTCGVLMAPAPEETHHHRQAKPAPSAGPPSTFNMDGLQIDGLALDWKDDQVGGAHFEIKKGSVEVGPLRPGRRVQTPYKVVADCGNLGGLDLEGICVLASRTSVEGDLRISGMNGREISPYLGAGTTLNLDQGSFALKLAYSSEPAAVGGEHTNVSVTNLALEEKGNLLFGWDALLADLARSDPEHQIYVIDDLSIVSLRGVVTKLPDGRSRTFGFDRSPVTAADDSKTKKRRIRLSDPPPLPTVVLKHLELGASQVVIHDRSVPAAAEPPPFLVQDAAITNTSPFVLSGDDPTTAVLDLAFTAASGGAFEQATATLHAIPFDAEPQARIELDLKGLDGAEITKKSPGLSAKYDLSALRGGNAHLGINFTVKSHERLDLIGSSPAPLAFELGLDSFAVRSSPEGPVLLGLDELLLDVPTYDLQTGEIHAKKLSVANPTGIFAKEPEGFRTIDIVTRNPPPADPKQQPATPPAASKGAPFKIDQIVVADGDIAYTDSTLSPQFALDMRDLEIDIKGYTSDWKTERRRMDFTVRSRAGTWEDCKFKGGLSFAPRLDGDFDGRILSLPLERLNGYVEHDQLFRFTGGKIDLEMKGSFKQGHLKAIVRITLNDAEALDLEGNVNHVEGALNFLADKDGQIGPLEIDPPVELDLDQDFHTIGPAKYSIGSLITQALSTALKGAVGGIANALTGGALKTKKVEEPRVRGPVPFGPVETDLPASAHAELDGLVEKLKENPLFFVSLRGEIGRNDEARAREIAKPPAQDRRDLIARLEAERVELERARADAIAMVRGGLQMNTSDEGVGRARLVNVTARLAKIDKSLDDFYEQEREGATRGADKRVREIENELCDNRAEAVAAYMIGKGAPAERIKRRGGRLKPITDDVGTVAVEAWTAHRAAIEKTAVEQKPR
jgi:hypothetical protein